MKARMQLLAPLVPGGAATAVLGDAGRGWGGGSPLSLLPPATGPNRAHCPCQTMNRVDSCPGMVGERLQPADRNRNMGGA